MRDFTQKPMQKNVELGKAVEGSVALSGICGW